MEIIKDLRDLLLYQVQNLYSAEEQQIQALPAIIEKATHRSLKNALQHHLELTKEHKDRLGKIPPLVNEITHTAAIPELNSEHISKGIGGLIEEAHALLNDDLAKDVTDAAIIACVQKIEHYEISTYGSALAYAVQLKFHKVEVLLKEILGEEYDADDLLTALATASLNKEAMPEGQEASDEVTRITGEQTSDPDVLYTGEQPDDGSERTINSPGGRAGTSHRGYSSGESRGH